MAMARGQGPKKLLFLLSEAGAVSACLYANGSDPGEGDSDNTGEGAIVAANPAQTKKARTAYMS